MLTATAVPPAQALSPSSKVKHQAWWLTSTLSKNEVPLPLNAGISGSVLGVSYLVFPTNLWAGIVMAEKEMIITV